MRSPHSILWPILFLAVATAPPWVRGKSLPQAQRDVAILFSVPESTVSVHEPVYIEFSIRNGLNEGLRFDMGYDGKHNFEFTVVAPDGSVIRTAPPRMGGEVMGRFADRAPLAPGETFTKKMVLNEWYDFPVPGDYKVEAKLGGQVQTVSGTPVGPAPRQEIRLKVTARNPARLETVCAELATKATGKNAEQASQAAFALSYINDPIAVPYLGRILKQGYWGKQSAVRGLARIGDAEALQVLTSNSDTQDSDLRNQINHAIEEIRARPSH